MTVKDVTRGVSESRGVCSLLKLISEIPHIKGQRVNSSILEEGC